MTTTEQHYARWYAQRRGPYKYSIEDIVIELSEVQGVNPNDVVGPKRDRDLAYVRHAVAWAVRFSRPELTLKRIGQAIGGRDHSSVYNSVVRVQDALAVEDPLLAPLARYAKKLAVQMTGPLVIKDVPSRINEMAA